MGKIPTYKQLTVSAAPVELGGCRIAGPPKIDPPGAIREMPHQIIYNQAGYPGLAPNADFAPDGAAPYTVNGYAGIGGPQHYFPFSAVKSEFVDFGGQGDAESSPQVVGMPWNPFSHLESPGQTGFPGSGFAVREENPGVTQIRRPTKRGRDPQEDPDSPKGAPQPALSSPPSYGQYWGPSAPSVWQPALNPTSTPRILESPPQTNPAGTPAMYLSPSYQSPNSSADSGIPSPETTRCSSAASSGSALTSGTPGSESKGLGNSLASDSEEEVPSSAEMEEFAKELKHKRITMGFTQADVGNGLGALFDKTFSQTTICRFESLQLSFKNMCKLQPLLKSWLHEVETNEDSREIVSRGEMLPHTVRRKHRTCIDAMTRRNLESHFSKCAKPGPQDINQIARDLNMEKSVVRVWFCNRRQKGRRQIIKYNLETTGFPYAVTGSTHSFTTRIFTIISTPAPPPCPDSFPVEICKAGIKLFDLTVNVCASRLPSS
ncbi:POU domain, class 5, transcription factor 1.2-like [Spea bombifrons]|uniref:POU domain, class 5, transcription factor 1.2-like n=1 Tax=Spea bombifrons TaxID=233779 RepID=UPI00234B0B7D|nr:POU domain, class 5, transcription factor 1.2-like [Spea bombifrons]